MIKAVVNDCEFEGRSAAKAVSLLFQNQTPSFVGGESNAWAEREVVSLSLRWLGGRQDEMVIGMAMEGELRDDD